MIEWLNGQGRLPTHQDRGRAHHENRQDSWMRRSGWTDTDAAWRERCPAPSSHPCKLFRFSGTAQSHNRRARDGAARTLKFCLCRLTGGCLKHRERPHSSRLSFSLSSCRNCQLVSSKSLSVSRSGKLNHARRAYRRHRARSSWSMSLAEW